MRTNLSTPEGQLFRRLFDHAPVIGWVLHPDLNCTYLSPAWYRHTGFAPGTGEGQRWMAAVHPDDLSPLQQAQSDTIDWGQPFTAAFRLRRAEGGYARIEAHGTLRSAGDCDIFGMAFAHADQGAIAPALSPALHGSLAKLTPRERDVLNLLTAGETSGKAGTLLGISQRTVEVHRAHLMTKLGARNAADLTRIAMLMGQDDLDREQPDTLE